MTIGPDKATSLARTLHEVALYPPHPPRTPTARYLATHQDLVVTKDLPCLVCGVRNSTLGNPAQNPRGAVHMETHHRYVEDSLANAVDVAKFNRKILPALLRKSGDQAKYGHPFALEEMRAWIHGDADNMWVLCDVCHLHPLVGIHAITGPIWGVQDLLIDGYDLTGFHAVSPQDAAALSGLPTTTGTALPPDTAATAPQSPQPPVSGPH